MTGTEVNDDKSREKSPLEVTDEDLGLVDDSLEDEGKEDAEIWAELDEEESGAADTDAPGEPGADSDEALENADPADAQDEADEEEETADEQPEAAAADPWASATPAQKKALEDLQAQIARLEQSDRSQRGRLAAAQRQINELTAGKGKPAATNKGAAGDTQAGPDNAEDLFAGEDFKSFSDEYPEVAAPLRKIVEKLNATITHQQKQLDAIGTDRLEEAVAEQSALLTEEHADWQDVVAAPEFAEWLDSQPRHMKEAAIRNAEQIVDAAEAADVVGRFKAFRSTDGGGQSPTNRQAGNGKANGTQPRLTGRRQRQLESASGTRTGGPGAAALGIPEDGDPEDIWKAFDKAEKRQAQRA